MAGSYETVEYLLESQHYFRNEIPPFTRRGLPEKRKKNISVRLKHNGRFEAVEYRRYRSTDHNYATLKIDGLTYIVMALPQGWERGNSAYSHGGCRSWFAWQGPRQQFIGRRFQGSVAVSTSISERSSDIGSDPMSSKRLSSPHTVIKSSTSPVQRALELSPAPSEMDSSFASSDRLPTSRFVVDPYEQELADEQEPAEGYRISTRRATRCSTEDLHEVFPSNPEDPSQTLTRQEEAEIWMRICVPGEEDRFRPMFLSSARPSSDAHGPVTHRSLFEKITRVCNLGQTQIQQLEVKIDKRHIMRVMLSRHTVTFNQVSFQIGREEEESWHLFVAFLKYYIERPGCDDWHLVIVAHVPT